MILSTRSWKRAGRAYFLEHMIATCTKLQSHQGEANFLAWISLVDPYRNLSTKRIDGAAKAGLLVSTRSKITENSNLLELKGFPLVFALI